MAERNEKVTSRDVPGLLATLSGEDQVAKQEALRLLCPCRNRRYDREVWRAIFRAHADTEGLVRDQAAHAIQTLFQRARTDPRTQDLLRWLESEGLVTLPLEMLIPVWQPRTQIAGKRLAIPRFQHPRRSAHNRR